MGTTVKSQSRQRVLLLGTGYTARALIPALQARGYHITGTTRDNPEALAKLGITSVQFDGTPNNALGAALSRATIILSSIPPRGGRDPFISAYPNLLAITDNLKWAGYLSATSVYGDRSGHWVFEDELLRPSTQRGKDRIEAELDWLESDAPVHVFRLAGIYGPERSPFAKIKNGSAQAIIKPGHVTNRIHVEDIVSAVLASIDRPDPGQVYNIADGHPCPPQDVLDYAANLIGAPRPQHVPLETADISDMARSFYQDNKRVSIARAETHLDWTPRYADYREGLAAILSQGL